MEKMIILLPLLCVFLPVIESQYMSYGFPPMVPRYRPFVPMFSPMFSPYGRYTPYGRYGMMMRPGLNRFYPAYSRDITPLGRPHPVYPGAVRPIGMNPLYGINSAGGGATLIRLMDGRKMLIPSAEGAARGQRAMLMTRDSAIAGATPVSPSVAAHLHRMIAPTIGHNQFRVMGFLSERATHMIFKASPRTPLVRTLNSFSGRFL